MQDSAVPTPDPGRSHTVGRTDLPLLERTIGDAVDATARRHPEREALVELATGRRWTYAELLAAVTLTARALLASGVRRGHRVGLWAPRSAEWAIVQLATAKIGAVLLPLDPDCPAGELSCVLRQAGVGTIVVAPPSETSDQPGLVEQVRGECPDLMQVLVIGSDGWAEFLRGGPQASLARIAELQAELSPVDPVTLQLTSGAAGSPRGITVSHRSILNTGHLLGRAFGCTERDVVCAPLPPSPPVALLIATLAATTHGACLVIPGPGPDPATTLRAVREEECTVIHAAPATFAALRELVDEGGDRPDTDLASVRAGVVAGSEGPVAGVRGLVETGLRHLTTYDGPAESCTVALQTDPADPAEKRASTQGRVASHLQVKIVDPATRTTVPRGEPGELCVSGYAVMLGYWDEPTRTSEVLVDGWLMTGRRAVMDEDGYVTLGRRQPGPGRSDS